jgi:pyridoxine 5-phosphate synthase
MPLLGVNIDHVATLRQARRGREPDPVWAAAMAEIGGADGITLHVREDRRHIQDRDARLLRETVTVKYNLEMAASDSMVRLAIELRPDQATLVPERREEVTTEGGLDVRANLSRIKEMTHRLLEAGIEVSMFIDPDEDQVQASLESGAGAVELHTGSYANATRPRDIDNEVQLLFEAGKFARERGLTLHLGHGLNYVNLPRLLSMPGLSELNIGHSIISRSVFVGLTEAVREMKRIVSLGYTFTGTNERRGESAS